VIIWLRSALFNALFFSLTALLGLLAMPLQLMSRRHTIAMVRFWANSVVWLLRVICRVTVDLRGFENLPPGAVVIAAKHQSAFDTIIWLALLPDAAYVLKKQLLYIPLYGWHVRRLNMIPVDRAGGGPALRAMLRIAVQVLERGRQVVIFPEGTRTAPGERVPYQPGVVAIAGATKAPVIPVATDSGRIWGRRSFRKFPGVIRISILAPLSPAKGRAALLPMLEQAIEAETDRLMAEPRDPRAQAPVEKSVE
jgi:1-acyl-sn-glycerol-3-phosphate acyltransferase